MTSISAILALVILASTAQDAESGAFEESIANGRKQASEEAPKAEQERMPAGFTETIQRIANARNRIIAYDVTINCRVANTLKRVLLSNGSVHEVEETPVAATLKMLYDTKQSKFLVARKDVHLMKVKGDQETSKWRVFGRTLGPIRGKQRKANEGRFIGDSPTFFDPLALGLFFEGEFRRGDRWESIIACYLEWQDDFEVTTLKDDRVRYDSRGLCYVIDTKRDCWPIAMIRWKGRDRDTILMQTAIKLSEVDGMWMPSYAAVVVPNETVVLEFDWHSVNRPISKERFTAEDIQARFGVSLTGR